MSPARRPTVALVGAGRAARALGPVMARAGYVVAAVAARDRAAANRLCREIPGARATTRAGDAAASARLVILAVPDREIAPAARRLAGALDTGWSQRVALHLAGALGPAPLEPLRRAGAAVGVFHPLQCLGRPEVARSVLRGSGARIEGDRRAVSVARRLARDLGLIPLALAPRLGSSGRSAYHAAASLVSNDLAALLVLAVDLFERSGVRRPDALRTLIALARGTLSHAEEAGLESALTGPVVRGDAATVAAQIRSLRRRSRAGSEAHRLLSLVLLRVAEDRLSPARRKELRGLLDVGGDAARPRAGRTGRRRV